MGDFNRWQNKVVWNDQSNWITQSQFKWFSKQTSTWNFALGQLYMPILTYPEYFNDPFNGMWGEKKLSNETGMQ